MNRGRRPLGFTIVETMIVLAISGLLVISAFALISGRQDHSEFQTAINSLQQQLQEIINQTQSGYYPNQGNFSCSGSASIAQAPIITAIPHGNSQGTNGSCIFLGNVIYFGPGQPDGHKDQFAVFPIVGNRLTPGLTPVSVTSFSQAWPVTITQGHSTNLAAPADAYTVNTMQYGLTFVWGKVASDGDSPYALALLNSLNSGADAGATDTDAFRLYGFLNGFYSTDDLAGIADDINSVNGTVPASSAASTNLQEENGNQNFCIASGTTNESGLFTITDGLTVTLSIRSNSTCA